MTIHKPTRDELIEYLGTYRLFSRLGPDFLSEIAERMTWEFLPGGDILFEQGDRGDCLYVVLGGRLRVYTRKGVELRVIGEIKEGETVGELALLGGGKRSASVVALRDTYLVRFTREAFDELVEAFPKLMVQVALFIGRRFNRFLHDAHPAKTMTNFAVLGLSGSVNVEAFTQRLTKAMASVGSTLHLCPERVCQDLYAQWPEIRDNLAFSRRLGEWLNDMEHQYRFLIYQCDLNNPQWTSRSLRQADCVLLVGMADEVPGPQKDPIWQHKDVRNVGRHELVLLHKPGIDRPRNTSDWLLRVPDTEHHHIQQDRVSDYQRVARLVSGRALGLVLGGGGARGFAHIGVIRAFKERGLPLDLVGGTSMGALIGAQLAMGWDVEQITAANRQMFVEGRSIWDYTLPLISLVRGNRFKKMGEEMFEDITVEDLWLPFFCISANLSRALQNVHRRGLLRRWLAATTALPGMLPPLYEQGELLVDGGLVNNVPADVMDNMDRGAVCAVDVSPMRDKTLRTNEPRPPSPWRLMISRLNPFSKTIQAPGMLNTMIRSATITNAGGLESLKHHIALHMSPPLEEVSMLHWKELDRIAELGYTYAMTRLEDFRWPR